LYSKATEPQAKTLPRAGEAQGGVVTRHYSYKAENDFPHGEKALELKYKPFIYIRDNKSSMVEL